MIMTRTGAGRCASGIIERGAMKCDRYDNQQRTSQ